MKIKTKKSGKQNYTTPLTYLHVGVLNLNEFYVAFEIFEVHLP